MKHIRLFIGLLLLCLIFSPLAFSQISHGGMPYFLQPSILRSVSSNPFFVEMPPFNLDSVLKKNTTGEGRMRGGFQFAYKFSTRIDINDGLTTVLPDGTTVRQIGICSPGAYSINLLLRDFEIPPGGKLFVYNANYSFVVGSFDYRNNSSDKILPIQPVAGDSIIVEYSEPADVPFKGHFVISEVNHDYRDIFRREPASDNATDYACMPDVFCSGAADIAIRSTVMVIINGGTACTGSLLNNTADDGTPYLLTSSHCFCSPTIIQNMDSFNQKAKTIIVFFNYNRPVCDANIKMKGSEEMSLSGAVSRAILQNKDIALLELQNSPPNYYNVYYSGWSMDTVGGKKQNTNIHHPSAAVKKYGMTDKNVGLVRDQATIALLGDPNKGLPGIDATSLWEIPSWTIGSTYSGSSGSPLFDENNFIIGGLTGGSSECSETSPSSDPRYQTDYFFSLGKGWVADNQLKTYLDPKNKKVAQYSGKDPNQANPVIYMKNADYTKGDSLITSVLNSPNQGYVFGNSNLQTLEFAEEFNVTNSVTIFGVYLLIPAMSAFIYTDGVTVSVYTGVSSPETKVYSTPLVPKYLVYTSSGFDSTDKTLTVPTETFVVFDKPVPVSAKKFFISYSINYSTTAQFCVYNTKFQNSLQSNTAWVKDSEKGWVQAANYEAEPLKTSLAIRALVQNGIFNPIEKIPVPDYTDFYYDRSSRVLTLKEPVNTSDAQTQVAVYSVSGQLLERIQIQQGQTTVILRERPKGTVGIVKITGDYSSRSGKIIF